MKKLIYLIALIVLGTGSAYSQNGPRKKPQVPNRQNEMAWMQKNLNLSEKQIAELRKLNQEQFKTNQKIREANRKQLKRNNAIRTAYLKDRRAKMEKILTKDQIIALQRHRIAKLTQELRKQNFRPERNQNNFPRPERPKAPRGNTR